MEEAQDRPGVGVRDAAARLPAHALDVVRPHRIIVDAAAERPRQLVALRAAAREHRVVGAHLDGQLRGVESVAGRVRRRRRSAPRPARQRQRCARARLTGRREAQRHVRAGVAGVDVLDPERASPPSRCTPEHRREAGALERRAGDVAADVDRSRRVAVPTPGRPRAGLAVAARRAGCGRGLRGCWSPGLRSWS